MRSIQAIMIVFALGMMFSAKATGQTEELTLPTEGEYNEQAISIVDEILGNQGDSLRSFAHIPDYFYGPVVFNRYYLLDTLKVTSPRPLNLSLAPDAALWLNDDIFRADLMRSIKQDYMIANPRHVKYNGMMLPEPPPMFKAVVDPRNHKLRVDRIASSDAISGVDMQLNVKPKNWIHTFEGSLQFSQSYLSPNWYQGGNGSLNSIGNVMWGVKLNPTYHPNLMFETTVQYKLAVNNAPDDSLHRYNISEDIFRITSKFGVKAAKRWFYSLSVQFKTQFLNSYKKNTRTMTAALLSPGELNVGLGMTYNYASPGGNFSFDASVSPIAWNLKTCISTDVDPVSLGIKAGKKVSNELGTTAEGKLKWKLSSNITYDSRIFLFTDYTYLQGDWENTLTFDINRFLATKIYVHLRYDSSTNPGPEATWRYWQLKEIFSFGFSYKFAN